jgi:two-component system sensor histidine kinase/response regulator
MSTEGTTFRARPKGLGLNARILTICGLPLVAMAILTSLVVHWSTRRFVEDAIGEQMVMQARIVSHLVAVAQEQKAGALSPDAINRHFKDMTRFAKEHGNYDYEFWVSDSAGKVVLSSTGIEFTFTPEQEQAGAFLRLLDGGPRHAEVVVQESQKRQIDSQIFKYVGVSGVDRPRIVEVGYRTESLLATLFWKNLLLAGGVAGLLLGAGVLAYALLRRTVTAPLDQLVRAAKDVEAEQYQVGSLNRVRTRGDELGRLAWVFEDMVLKLATRYEELVNFMQSAVLKVRGDGVISFANTYASELFGYSRAELVGSPVTLIVPPERKDQIQAQLDGMKDQIVRVNEVRQNVTKTGKHLWMSWSDRQIKAGEGSSKELLVVGTDVTEEVRRKKELEELKQKAEEATQMKSMFLANMSHEIRTPMNAIIGLSHLALKTSLTPKQKDYVGKIHNAGTSLLAVINDILDFSKIEAGKLNIEVTDFRLDEVIGSVTTLTAQKAHEKGLEFLAHVSPNVPDHLAGDPLRLGQILTNFVNNAVKFTEKGEIRLEIDLVERVGEKVQLKFLVRDTGIGMTKEQAAKLFQPFTQADMSTTRKHGGTGLGLTICKRLVDLMGGRIWLESEAGAGSTFYFTAWLGVGSAPVARKILPERLSRLKALVVDDNATAREILQESLTGIASRVDTVASGEEAVAAVRGQDGKEPYDVVFLDWRMPGMDGLQASREIKTDRNLKHPPRLVLVTAFGKEEVREEAERLSLDGFLEKPVTRSMIVDTLVGLFAREGETAVRAERDLGTRLRGARILLTEDNEINQQIAVELLEGVGASVKVANNGRVAVELLFNGPQPPPFDVVLMDLQMPEMDGHQATLKIRSEPRFATLPIIAMTAHATIEERQRCLDQGMNDHVSKPIDPNLLFETVARFYKAPAETAATPAPPEAPPAADGIPAIEGLDSRDGLARVAGNRTLYLKLLRQFAQQQGPAPRQIADALATGDRKLAERLAHTVKGVAGSLGAKEVQQAAAELEKAIASGAATPDLSRVEAVLGAFVGRLRAALPAEAPASATPAAALDDGQIRAFLREMVAHLNNFDPAAGDLFGKHRDSLRSFFTPQDFESIDKQIGSFAFADALATLQRAARQKGIPLP